MLNGMRADGINKLVISILSAFAIYFTFYIAVLPLGITFF